MVIDFKIKTKSIDTSARPHSPLARPIASPLCGLTNPPGHCMLESECVYFGLFYVFVVNWV